MPESRTKTIETLFQKAADLPTDERAAFLDGVCNGDDELRREVEALLVHEQSAPASFLQQLPVGNGSLLPEDAAGATVGRYTILRPIGEGAFGAVYLAEQTEPVRRQVALKIVKQGMDTRQVVARFDAERQALAMMDHPGIAVVHDAGTTPAGRPYFVMEHVAGVPVTRFCDEQSLDTAARLRLFIEICDAIQHAHQKGIIHRDIKPSNILVAKEDTKARPKVIDFGIAKAVGFSLTDRTLMTEQGQLIGTPEYMSPEQADLSGLNVDTRSDIYSLGVVLYELLTGALPFDSSSLRGGTIQELQEMIREREPATPSTHRAALRGDLDWIVMKAIAKERSRRYASASELAADIERHLRGEPVLAGPPSAIYRMSKFVRRNSALVAAAAIAVAALTAGAGVATWQAINARAETAKAIVIKDLLGGIIRATDFEAGRLGARDILDKTIAEIERTLEGQPDVLAEMLHLIGMSYASMGALDEGVIQLQRALVIRSDTLGPDHADTLETAHRVGRVLATSYRWNESEEYLRMAVDGRRRSLRTQHPDTLTSESYLAQTLTMQGEWAAAEPLARHAFEGLTEQFGPEHERSLRARYAYHSALRRNGNPQEAAVVRLEGLEIARLTLDEEHPLRLNMTREHGAFLADIMNDFESARPYLESTLETRRRLYGDDDFISLYWMWTYGWLLHKAGRTEEGEPLMRRGLEGLRRVLGNRNLRTVTAIVHLSYIERAIGNREKAIDLLNEALDVKREILGDEHYRTLHTLAELGWLLHLRGDSITGEDYVRRAFYGHQDALGPDHPKTLTRMFVLGMMLLQLEQFEEAEQLLRDSWSLRSQVLGPEHSGTLDSEFELAIALWGLKRLDDAEVRFRSVLDTRTRVYGADKTLTLRTKSMLARFLNDQGPADLTEAETFAREAGDGFERLKGPAAFGTLDAREILARILIKLGRSSDAEQVFVDLLDAANGAGKHKRAAIYRLRRGLIILEDEERHDESEVELTRAYDDLREFFGDEADVTREAANALEELRKRTAPKTSN